jgi:zinc protease
MTNLRSRVHRRPLRLLRRLLLVVTVLAIALFTVHHRPALALAPRHYTEIPSTTPPEVKFPNFDRYQLSNGLTVYLIEDHELPLVSGNMMVRTGDRFEPADKIGLSGITGTVMRSGGTKNQSADTINDFLEQKAASVETGIGGTSGSAGFSSLTEDLDSVFGLFADTLRNPAFPQDKIDLSKNQIKGGIARRNDDPDDIAGRELSKLLYGTTSPYARMAEYATINAIGRNDVVKFYQQFYHPNNMLLGIIGDFDPTKMKALIQAKFGDWQASPSADAKKLALPAVNPAPQGGIYFVEQPQLTQSYIQMGQLGGKLDDPDHAALSVMNEVMNGFGARLMNEVRSRQGLAYVIYAYWAPQYDFPGVYIGGGQTRSDATVPFIKSTVSEIQKIQSAPVTADELKRAKDSVLNSFIFSFQTPGQSLSRLMRYEYFGYPQDFIFRYQKQVEATTAADVQRAARTHLTPDKLVTVVVGKSADINPALSTLSPDGKVTPIDITIPPPQ